MRKKGTQMKALTLSIAIAGVCLALATDSWAQTAPEAVDLATIPAVSGHEERLTAEIKRQLSTFSPITDNAGNVYVTIGSGSPHRLIATSIDEPGYVVSEITENGYLRVQRLPQTAPNAVFDSLQFAQPVRVVTRGGKEIPGVFAGLSVHLQPGRINSPKMNHVEELYVDIGAKSGAEARAVGVDLLDTVIQSQTATWIGHSEQAGTAVGDRFGVEALIGLLDSLDARQVKSTLSVAFVTQQWTGGRGLNRLLTELHPDEMVYVGRLNLDPKATGEAATPKLPGSGVLLATSGESAPPTALTAELAKLSSDNNIKVTITASIPPRIAGYAKSAAFPERFAQVGVAIKWPVTPAETIAQSDVDALRQLLAQYAAPEKNENGVGTRDGHIGTPEPTISAMVRAYGASGHESAVREEVKKQLPEWARKKVTTDAAGNLVLHWSDGKRDAKTPSIAFVAHMDELGFEVKKIEDGGSLLAESLGGGYPQYFLGHVALVHTKDETPVGGVMELPDGWDKPNFEFQVTLRSIDEPAHVYVGTRSKEATQKLGIAVGDYVTIPKQYRPLLGTRANARSFDDRVGCTALIEATRKLGPALPGRDVTFVWSTEEEVGLKGAAAFAEQAAKENRVPDFVFAIDTFVSSDSPLESKRFADAELGKGFVIRAVDNSNIAPLQYVDRVIALAKENKIPVQYGVTGGGNDGAVFTGYGSVDIPLGWPLRYSHSPAEVIDTKDLDALGQIVEVLARKW
jgi:putative aminopeptidase